MSSSIASSETPSMTQKVVHDTGYTAIQVLATVFAGLTFGFALHKGDVYRVGVIRDQMRFTNFTMLKMFLTAASFSTLSVTAMYGMKATHAKIKLIGDFVYGIDVGAVSTGLGGLLLGVGMALAGSCPGTVWAQIGAGSFISAWTFVGCLAAAAAYGFLYEPYMQPLTKHAILKKKFLFEVLGMSRTSAALWFVGMMAAVVVAVEASIPSRTAITDFSFTNATWNPIISGAIIGSLQLPLLMLVGKNLGSSSSFVTLAATCAGRACDNREYLRKFRDGFINWWQVLYVSSALAGSFVAYASSVNDKLYDASTEASVLQSLFGGFLIVFGARMANGCTSGHGMSGMAHQSLRSFLAVACMFAGGISTTLLFL